MEIFAVVIFCSVYSLEVISIFVGNSFTIFVFWKHRAKLKRASYLLVNLALADLLVAISSSYFLSCEVRDVAGGYYENDIQRWEFITFTSWDVFCGASSLLNLLVIAYERLYAIRWPFQHLALRNRTYTYSFVFVWITAGFVSVFYLTLFTVTPETSKITAMVATVFFLVVLILICMGYLLTHLQTRHNIPEGVNELRRAQQNKELTKTLLIVTVLSLICWFPSIVVALAFDYTNYYPWSSFNLSKRTHNVLRFVKFMQYGNSFVNPMVYKITAMVATVFFLVVLILICMGYLLTHLQTRHNIPEGVNELRRAQQNKELTKTLLIVTVLSLICWFPSIVVALAFDYTNYYPWSSFNLSKRTHNVLRFVKFMQYGNSFVNPMVYSFRMPWFKSEIKEHFSKLIREKNGDLVNQNKRKVALPHQGRQGNIDQAFFETKL